MPRDVDDKKTRKALRKLRKAKARAEAEGIDLTDWEKEFVEGVDERLTKYGSAFADLSLGGQEEALSNTQAEILRQLDKKSRGKSSGGFTTRKPLKAKKGFKNSSFRSRDIRGECDDDTNENSDVESEPSVPYTENLPNTLRVVKSEDTPSAEPPQKPARTAKGFQFRVIDGGKSE